MQTINRLIVSKETIELDEARKRAEEIRRKQAKMQARSGVTGNNVLASRSWKNVYKKAK